MNLLYGSHTGMKTMRIELPTPFPVGSVNAYLLYDGERSVLVDCGPDTPAARHELVNELKMAGFNPEDLSAVILTHGHVDHAGQAGWLQSLGVPVYAPPQVDTWLNPGGSFEVYRQQFYERLYHEQGVPQIKIEQARIDLAQMNQLQGHATVDVVMPYGSVCELLPQYTVLHVPGHAQHALALWDEQTGHLIVGDQLLPHISSNALIEPEMNAPSGAQAERTKSLLIYRDNLQFLQTLDVSTVYPGHGDVFTDAHRLLEKRLARQERRCEEFLRCFDVQPEWSAYELAVQYFFRHRNQTSLIMSETLGYLDWLAELGEICCTTRGGREAIWCRR